MNRTRSKILAAYLRISSKDGDRIEKEESNSITNQRTLIERYLLSHPDLADMTYTEYVDDGYTGTSTARPSFQSMIHAARKGAIGCIIVKDMSRFSRDYLTLGDYIEQILPMHGVRFISINDLYDSGDPASYMQSMSAALQGVVYDYYSKDISKKNGMRIEERMRNGTFITHSPYGYVTNWETRSYEIEPEAAIIVRLIFDLALLGDSAAQITKKLNIGQIPSPYQYSQRHPQYHKPWHKSHTKVILWTSHQVKRTIQNIAYTGTLELKKTHTNAPAHEKIQKVPKEDRILRENNHPALVSDQEFTQANQQIVRLAANADSRKRISNYESGIFLGKIFCGHCGLSMKHRAASMTLICRHQESYQKPCNDTVYSLPVLEDDVYFKLKPILEQAIKELKLQEQALRQAKIDLKDVRRRIVLLKRRFEDLLQEKRRLFEAFSRGDLTQNDYARKKEQLQTASHTLQNEIDHLLSVENELCAVSIDPQLRTFALKAEQYLAQGRLSRDMVTDFIDSIRLYRDRHYQITWRYPEYFHDLQTKANQQK